MTRPRSSIAALAAVCAVACAPALDWREFMPEGSGINVSFPCRPDRFARAVVLAGARTQMQMLSCSAGDATFALAFVDVVDATQIGTTLAELRASAVGNLNGATAQAAPLHIRGMTPNAQTGRLSVAGRLPDGAAVQEHAAFFTRGLRVYQATVIGAAPAPPAVEAFVAGLKFPG
jgi:hypothetical protein